MRRGVLDTISHLSNLRVKFNEYLCKYIYGRNISTQFVRAQSSGTFKIFDIYKNSNRSLFKLWKLVVSSNNIQ